MKFNKPCKSPGCRKLTNNGAYCDEHRLAETQYNNPYRKLYANPMWVKQSHAYLLEHTECVVCGDSATETDHIIPHRGNEDLFWDESNWQAICHHCHSVKTNQEIRTRRKRR